jgi:glycerophosphoryl diester phosphodiesterase
MKQFIRQLKLLLFLFTFACTASGPSGNIDKILEEFHDAGSGYVMVAAHRGVHHAGCPENSISAIKLAIELGADIVELDVRVTADSAAVLMHDETIDRTTNSKGRVEDYTLAGLREFSLKKPDGTLTDESIPTFTEALELIRGNIMVDIDLKTDMVEPIINAVKSTGTHAHVFYFDNDYEVLKEIRCLDERAIFMPRAYSLEMADSALTLFSPPVIHIDPSFYTAEVTGLIRSMDARVWINALGDPDEMIRRGDIDKVMDELLRHGANIIQTDEPERLLIYLRSEELHD